MMAANIPLALRREIEALEQVADVRNWGPPEMAEWNSAVAALCAKVEALMLDASVGMTAERVRALLEGRISVRSSDG
jgi:hypothetical protein